MLIFIFRLGKFNRWTIKTHSHYGASECADAFFHLCYYKQCCPSSGWRHQSWTYYDPGALGKDATLSLLVQEFFYLKARVKSQEQEIQTLKTQQATLGGLSQTSNQTSLLALQTKLDNMQQNVNSLMLNMAKPCAINSNHVGSEYLIFLCSN